MPKTTKNSHMHDAKKNKNDEFYTQWNDVEFELMNYNKHFEGKVIYCNCDDCYESNIFKFFALNFDLFKLKKLIATCYCDSQISSPSLITAGSFGRYPTLEDILKEKYTKVFPTGTYDPTKIAYKMTIESKIEDENGDGIIDFDDVACKILNNPDCIEILKGDVDATTGDWKYKPGDFRSSECIETLKISDIVVTNPPFSLFRELVSTLEKYKKKYILWANNNAITYKEIFPLIKENKLWLGYTSNKSCHFRIPDSYTVYDVKYTKKKKTGFHYATVPAISVFTNIEHDKRKNDKIILKCKYYGNESKYPKYDNYDAIEVGNVTESSNCGIPQDYEGIMGVPITFLGKYNPDQFEIINMSTMSGVSANYWTYINGVPRYARIYIKNKNVVK